MIGKQSSKSTEETDAFILLNLGCGVKTAACARNIDWSIYLRIAKSPALRAIITPFLSATRRARLQSLGGLDIVVHDLSRRIPAADGTVDMVYHSHLLEHLDRDVGEAFLRECHRVLRPGGLLRIVVPDLERIVRTYLASLESSLSDPLAAGRHDGTIAAMYEQSVRREGVGSTLQKPLARLLERFMLGDARARGETHQWMYDKVSLRYKLEENDFHSVKVHSFDTSAHANWNQVGLDRDGEQPYKPGSLYMEACKGG